MLSKATAEPEILVLLPDTDKVIMGFFIRNFLGTVASLDLCAVDGNRLILYYMGVVKNTGVDLELGVTDLNTG